VGPFLEALPRLLAWCRPISGRCAAISRPPTPWLGAALLVSLQNSGRKHPPAPDPLPVPPTLRLAQAPGQPQPACWPRPAFVAPNRSTGNIQRGPRIFRCSRRSRARASAASAPGSSRSCWSQVPPPRPCMSSCFQNLGAWQWPEPDCLPSGNELGGRLC